MSSINIFPQISLSDKVIGVCILFALVGFLLSVCREMKSEALHKIFLHAKRAGHAAQLPAAFMLFCGAIKPSILADVAGIRVLIAISGLIWIFYAAEAFLAEDTPAPIKKPQPEQQVPPGDVNAPPRA